MANATRIDSNLSPKTAQQNCAVFVNRLSGGVTPAILAEVKNLAAHNGWDYYECASPDDAKAAISAMANAGRDNAGNGLDVLILIGGDGTIIHALTLMYHHPFFQDKAHVNMPQILAIAGGTTNMIHRDVGHDLSKLGEICTKMRDGQLRVEKRQPIMVRPIQRGQDKRDHDDGAEHGAEQAYYGFFLATGAFADIITHIRATYHKAGLKTGLCGKIGEAMAAISFVTRLLCKGVANHKILHPRVLKISQDQQNWQSISHIFTFFISLQKMILGIRLNKPIQAMQAISLTWPYGRLVGDLLAFRAGKTPSGQAVQLHDYDQDIYIKNIHRWVLDGEIFPIDPDDMLHIALGDAVEFLVE